MAQKVGITIRFDDSEYIRLQVAANARGLTLTELVRIAALAHASQILDAEGAGTRDDYPIG
jgi:uncharacterized protein (DUF1778 family)